MIYGEQFSSFILLNIQMKKYEVIVNMNIAFEIEAENAQEAYRISQNECEAPHWYQDNTRDTVGVFRIDKDEDVDCWPEGEWEPE